MCGLTGIFNLNGDRVSEPVLRQMTSRLRHRGPDGDGIFLDENLGLGHRRLAILDISDKGAQPMTSGNGNWIVAFNGCIYNYRELKKQLTSRCHFVSTSDTEVICEGLSVYGPSFFERLDGMFAIAAWEKSTRTLYLSRDRYGIKPLYYYLHGATLLFASEIKAFLPHPAFKTELNFSALNEYFTFQNLFSYQSFFKGVKLLPPANTVKVENKIVSELNHHSWWDYDFTSPDNNISFEEAKHTTKELFRKAVGRQMVADVPVGSYLSGGIDSGSVTAIASGHVKKLMTFTCGFDMSQVTGVEANYDERRDAELMANYFKTEQYEQILNAGDIRWSLPRVVYHLEDIRVGMSYPNYYISRLASKFVKVCLQGTGGDELYGGYPWRYYRIFKSVSKKDFYNQYYEFWQRLVPEKDRGQLFTEHVNSRINRAEPREIFERVFEFNPRLNFDTPEEHIQNSLYFEIKTFLHGLLLVGDKLSMANGLEERFPFLDNDLVNFAQKIPIRHKLGNLETLKRIDENEFRDKRAVYREFDDGKNVFRKAMAEFLPEKILQRKKQGFSSPDESWYRGENAEYVKEILLNSKTISTEFINGDYIKKIVNEHIHKKINHRLLIWSFLNFEWWCRLFLDNQQIEEYAA